MCHLTVAVKNPFIPQTLDNNSNYFTYKLHRFLTKLVCICNIYGTVNNSDLCSTQHGYNQQWQQYVACDVII